MRDFGNQHLRLGPYATCADAVTSFRAMLSNDMMQQYRWHVRVDIVAHNADVQNMEIGFTDDDRIRVLVVRN